MADRPRVQKARIVNERKPGQAVVCHYNPQDFSLSKTIKWNAETNIGGDVSKLEFAGGESQDLTIPLLFDSTKTGRDVRDSYLTLLKLAQIDIDNKNPKTDKGEPPRCRFEWGKFLSFTAVITKISEKFLMFKADGTPVRVEVSVTFKQVGKAVRPQNPTSRSEPRRTWVVHEGERLDWIAHQEYGNSAHWRHIAETNNLSNPKDLRSGQILKLVPLP